MKVKSSELTTLLFIIGSSSAAGELSSSVVIQGEFLFLFFLSCVFPSKNSIIPCSTLFVGNQRNLDVEKESELKKREISAETQQEGRNKRQEEPFEVFVVEKLQIKSKQEENHLYQAGKLENTNATRENEKKFYATEYGLNNETERPRTLIKQKEEQENYSVIDFQNIISLVLIIIYQNGHEEWGKSIILKDKISDCAVIILNNYYLCISVVLVAVLVVIVSGFRNVIINSGLSSENGEYFPCCSFINNH